MKEFNLQLFGEESATIETFEVEIDGEKITLPKQVNGIDFQKIHGKTIANTRKGTELKYKAELDKVNGVLANQNLSLAEKEEALRKFEEEKLSVEERLSKEFTRKEKKYTEELGIYKTAAEKNFQLFASTKIENEIYSALPLDKLAKPDDTIELLKLRTKPTLVEVDGKYKTVFKMDVDGEERELTAKEASEIFLAANPHHLKSSLIQGMGTSTLGGRSMGGGLVYSRREMNSNPNLRGEYNKKLMSGENVQIID